MNSARNPRYLVVVLEKKHKIKLEPQQLIRVAGCGGRKGRGPAGSISRTNELPNRVNTAELRELLEVTVY